ncbi:methyl-accepting chemotaxis protein [Oceanobacillus rekensis]|uniref:methyl-accepting chemotaxis protein n=1 Tax=Oceanobacillus rekensis TaxID=937927 RepID=UPI000B43E1BF|nr:methyl-accepting chemotaxis protein [Oceanobacillus rekensis]
MTITTNIKKTVTSVDESFKNVEVGEQTVNETGESLEKIRSAVNNIVGEIGDLSALTHDEAETSEHIVQLVNRLEEANEKMAAYAQEVSAASEESTATVDDVASRTDSLTEMANELNSSVNQFRGV